MLPFRISRAKIERKKKLNFSNEPFLLYVLLKKSLKSRIEAEREKTKSERHYSKPTQSEREGGEGRRRKKGEIGGGGAEKKDNHKGRHMDIWQD